MKKPLVEVDVDTAYCVSNGPESVYFDVSGKGARWWISAIVDSDSGGFVEDLVRDDGPYKSMGEAVQAALDAAIDWFVTNDLHDFEIDPRLMPHQ